MTESPESHADDAALKSASAKLDAALARLERGVGALAGRVADAPQPGAGPREAALEAALREASATMGGLIAEVRAAIAAAEEAAAADASPGAADGER